MSTLERNLQQSEDLNRWTIALRHEIAKFVSNSNHPALLSCRFYLCFLVRLRIACLDKNEMQSSESFPRLMTDSTVSHPPLVLIGEELELRAHNKVVLDQPGGLNGVQSSSAAAAREGG